MPSGVRKKDNHSSILDRQLSDERYNKKSEVAIRWNETYCKYLDNLTTIYISYNATYHRRHRYENTNTMNSGDPDLETGPTIKREDYKQ